MFASDDGWNVEDELSLDFSCLESPEKKPRVDNVVFDSKMTFNGFSYTKKSTAINGGHAFYQCRSYRSPHYCKASIKYTSEGIIIEREKTHTCPQNGQLKSIKVGEITDVQAEMRQMIIDNCLDDATKSATEVAKHVFETTVQKYEGIFLHITLPLR
jgi:FLYWCH zinc finger domain